MNLRLTYFNLLLLIVNARFVAKQRSQLLLLLLLLLLLSQAMR